MNFSAKLVNEFSQGPVEPELVFEGVATDTRKDCTNKLFIPIVGEVFDGHRFIDNAIANGATGTLWEKNKPFPKDLQDKIKVYFVDDTTIGLQELAKQVLRQHKPYVIGVTGSNGKTTVKDMLEAVLSPKYQTYKTQGNLNNHWGLPMTVLAMPEETDVLILEMGMSGMGEISLLTKIATPDVAVITNIGESHLLQLGSRENIAKAKMEIAEGLKTDGLFVIDGDEPLLERSHKNTIACGYLSTNDLQIDEVEKRQNGYAFTLKNEKEPFEIHLLGKHNIKNALYSIASARKLGVSDNVIRKALSSLTLTGMRLEQFKVPSGALIINDAYNASPTSMKAAIETLVELEGFEKKIAILGDMYELGGEEEALHRSIASAIREPITEVITVGEKAKWIYKGLTEDEGQRVSAVFFENKQDAASYLAGKLDDKTAVLLKASRGLGLESIIETLGN
ncbi:MAG: UDP-N-acetylmuramoyl-tripeptide--D-alanyl-D-alanine ligase [Anaerobacillus sp.]